MNGLHRERRVTLSPARARVRRLARLSAGGLVLAGILSLSGASSFASRAYAHATPHVLDIVFRDSGNVLLSNRGLIFGDAAHSTWSLMCAEALGINTSEVPSIVGLPDGRVIVATSRGLSVTSDQGCTWQPVAPFGDVSTPAMAADLTNPKRTYLAAYTPDPMKADLGGLFVSDDATTWTRLLPANDHEYIRSIVQAPSDPMRIYAAGQTWDMMGKYTYYLTQSKDGGKTWERQDVPLEKTEVDLQLFSIHPKDPNILAVRAGGDDPMNTPERLLISKDGGKTFTSPFGMRLLSQLSFNTDGSKAWVVGYDGFFESTDGLVTFNQIQPSISMSYVKEHDGEVLAAGYYKGIMTPENGIGMAKAAQDGFTPYMQMTDIKQQVQCDPSSMTAMKCASWWVDWQNELMSGQFTSPDGGVSAAGTSGATSGSTSSGDAGVSALDAGVAGASGSAGSAGQPPTAAGAGGASGAAGATPPTKSDDGGCGVAAPSGERGLGFGAFVSLVAVAAFVRRRRSRR